MLNAGCTVSTKRPACEQLLLVSALSHTMDATKYASLYLMSIDTTSSQFGLSGHKPRTASTRRKAVYYESVTYEEAAVALAANLGPNHMDVGDADTVWVACVGMPVALS